MLSWFVGGSAAWESWMLFVSWTNNGHIHAFFEVCLKGCKDGNTWRKWWTRQPGSLSSPWVQPTPRNLPQVGPVCVCFVEKRPNWCVLLVWSWVSLRPSSATRNALQLPGPHTRIYMSSISPQPRIKVTLHMTTITHPLRAPWLASWPPRVHELFLCWYS